MSTSGGYLVDISVPSVFGNFEATLGVLAAEAILLLFFLITSFNLSGKDVSKPFLAILSLTLGVNTAGTITLFVFKMNYMTAEACAYASIVRQIARFASVNVFLFGGGYFFLGAGNAVRTRAPSGCCSSWFIHLLIAAFSIAVGVTTVFCSFELESIPLFLFKTMPSFGFVFLMTCFVLGTFMSCCDGIPDDDEHRERFLVDAKSRFGQYFTAFTLPTAMICYTKSVDGLLYIIRIFSYNGFRYWSRYTIRDMATSYSVTFFAKDIDNFLTIAICLSAFVFHPSVRNVICCSAKTAKKNNKVAPAPEPAPPAAYTNPMMMAPMVPMVQPVPQMMASPAPMPQHHAHAAMPHVQHIQHHQMAPLPPLLHHHGLPMGHSAALPVYGMGARPAYMMA